MSTLFRNPLSSRSTTNHLSASSSATWKTNVSKSSSVKRARSPEPGDSLHAKRTKALFESPRLPAASNRDEARRRDGKETKETKEDRDRKRLEREEEFRVKYTRAFPNWVFYFDLDLLEPDTASVRKELERLVMHMGAVSTLHI